MDTLPRAHAPFRTALGRHIFLDRYALKAPDSRAAQVGDTVVVHEEEKGGSRSWVGRVEAVPHGNQGPVVQPEQDGAHQVVPWGKLDLCLEITPEQAWDRMARAAAAHEDPQAREYWQKEFRWLLDGFRFVPAGRVWTGLGREHGAHVTLANCFVLGHIPDSREGIFERLQEFTNAQARGGGVGVNGSGLRYRDAPIVKVNGRSSGAVSWMGLFAYMSNKLINQGGSRRGASLIQLEVWHPDILEFISCKKTPGFMEGANISVGISDDFMAAVKADGPWELVFPDTAHPEYRTRWDGSLARWKAAGLPLVVHQTLPARKLWQTLCESAWASAEPGLIFLDRMRAESNSGYYPQGEIVCTNPCVHGDTMIATLQGPRRIADLEGQDIQVYSWDPQTKQPVVRWMRRIHKTRENAEVVRVVFDSGLELVCTPDHHLYTFRGKKIKAKNLRPGQAVRAAAVSTHKDGQLRAHAGDGPPKYVHRLLWESYHGEIPEGYVLHHINENPTDNRIENLELKTPAEHNREHYPGRRSNGFQGHKNFPEVLARARERKATIGSGNHRVLSVTPAGRADVYNGMVEGSHTYVICDPEYRGKSTSGVFSGIVSANCGEQPLPADSACNLGHLHLGMFVTGSGIDLLELDRAVAAAVRFQDNVIDLSAYPHEKARSQQQLERRVGLGTLGLAEAMVLVGHRYGSPEAVAWCRELYAHLATRAYQASMDLAEERGAFPAYAPEFWERPFARRMAQRLRHTGPIRNVTLLTQAPTGSVGTMCATSTGVEPFFELEWEREGRFGRQKERAWVVDEWARQNPAYAGISPFVTAMELTPAEHVRTQAAIQEWTDASISKTTNCPADWSADQVRELYELMYDLGCKGGTVYRDGSRKQQVLHRIEAPKTNGKAVVKPVRRPALMPCPSRAPAVRVRKETPSGTAHILGTTVDGDPCELFVDVGKAGSDLKAMAEALGRLVSLVLRLDSSVPPRERAMLVAHQLEGIGGPRTAGFGPNRTRSVPDAVAAVLMELWGSNHEEETVAAGNGNGLVMTTGDLCPDCGRAAVRLEEGCEKCNECGWSVCG